MELDTNIRNHLISWPAVPFPSSLSHAIQSLENAVGRFFSVFLSKFYLFKCNNSKELDCRVCFWWSWFFLSIPCISVSIAAPFGLLLYSKRGIVAVPSSRVCVWKLIHLTIYRNCLQFKQEKGIGWGNRTRNRARHALKLTIIQIDNYENAYDNHKCESSAQRSGMKDEVRNKISNKYNARDVVFLKCRNAVCLLS